MIYLGKKDLQIPCPTIKESMNPFGISYNELLGLFGKTIHSVAIGSYSGDELSIIEISENLFGYLCTSYGSCAYCDWLESVETKEELQEFVQDMHNRFIVGTIPEMLLFLNSHD